MKAGREAGVPVTTTRSEPGSHVAPCPHCKKPVEVEEHLTRWDDHYVELTAIELPDPPDYVPLDLATGGNGEYMCTSGMGNWWYRMTR